MSFSKFGNVFHRNANSSIPTAVDGASVTSESTSKKDLSDDKSTLTVEGDTDAPLNDAIPTGSCLEVKRVDEHYDAEQGIWVPRERAVPVATAVEKDPYDPYAFTVVRKYDMYSTPAQPIFTTLLDIKSPQLKKVGKEVIGAVQGISWTLTPLRIDPKNVLAFVPHLQDHADLLSSANEKTEEQALTLAHLNHLLTFLRTEHASTLKDISTLLAHDEMSFALLWAILVPRTILYTACPTTGEPRAVRLINASLNCCGGQQYWQLQTEYVEYNSQHRPGDTDVPEFGLAPMNTLTIMGFVGAMKISNLPCYPMRWYPKAEELRERLVSRGEKWLKLQGVHHMYYNGTGFHARDGKFNVDSRIMIDWGTFAQINPNYHLPAVSKTLSGGTLDRHPTTYGQSTKPTRTGVTTQLEDSHLMLASPIVYGFSLSDKVWLEFNVDCISTFEWSDEPFSNLVLPDTQKTLVKSLVEAHTKNNTGFDDFVKGKGRGLVMNLFGNPGVGKSLTAEATSEHARRPLYIVGAGDLGTTASVLDRNLTQIFNISTKWGAVVLIDEADVFLEERSLHDLERNAVVAVFLRQLEYFRGILFLTTNRVRTFDEAFQSRIHVSLRYRDLTADAKCKIWAAFLKKASGGVGISLTDKQLQDLGEKPVNGRQIKNAVRTASALASSCDEELAYDHLIQVLEMMEQFEIDRST